MWVIESLCCTHFPDTQFIIEEPSSQAVPTNGSLQLSCTAPNATDIEWARGQPEAGLTPVMSSSDPRVTTDGDSLEVTPFHAIEHIGLYYCLATLESGDTVRSCPANISHASEQTIHTVHSKCTCVYIYEHRSPYCIVYIQYTPCVFLTLGPGWCLVP